jgi:hypothetical protein
MTLEQPPALTLPKHWGEGLWAATEIRIENSRELLECSHTLTLSLRGHPVLSKDRPQRVLPLPLASCVSLASHVTSLCFNLLISTQNCLTAACCLEHGRISRTRPYLCHLYGITGITGHVGFEHVKVTPVTEEM